MKKIALLVVVLAFVLIVGGSQSVQAEGTQTLKGSFVWNNENKTGEIEAVFTETGKGKWDVSFNFTWEDEPHTYSGTAEGSLSEGELKGKVLNDTEEHSFTFSGSVKDGTFDGTHASIRDDGSVRDTGTLKLSH